jgi:hypothetical protein
LTIDEMLRQLLQIESEESENQGRISDTQT